VFALAIGGLWLALRGRKDEKGEAQLFLVALIAPMTLYFLFHSLHARVHGNWVAPAYPVLAVLGAQAAFHVSDFSERIRSTITLSRRLAVPVGVGIAAVAYVQAAAAPIPVDPAKDPTALMAGWSDLAHEVERVARRENVSYVLTSSYALTSELSFYADGTLPIVQFEERIRWLSFPRPPAAVFYQRGLYVADTDRDRSADLAHRFFEFRKIGELARTRNGKLIAEYVIYLVEKPTEAVLDSD